MADKERAKTSLHEAHQLDEQEQICFAAEAAVALCLTVDSASSTLFNAESGQPLPELAKIFSLFKHGSEQATEALSALMFETALQTPSFLKLIEAAQEENRPVFITSPSIVNVRSASNNLLHSVATRINNWLSITGKKPLIVSELKKTNASNPHYTQMSIAERAQKKSIGLIPSYFNNASVVFVDDIYISGTVLRAAKRQLYDEGKAASVYFLLAAKMDGEVVKQSDGSIEHVLNTAFIDGELDTYKHLLGDLSVVQKTLRVFFNPKHAAQLSQFIEQFVSDHDLLALYEAASSNDFRNIYPETKDSIAVALDILQKRNLVDQYGNRLVQPMPGIHK